MVGQQAFADALGPMQQQGVGLRQFLGMVQQFCEQNIGNAAVAEFIGPLATLAKEYADTTMAIGKKAAGNLKAA